MLTIIFAVVLVSITVLTGLLVQLSDLRIEAIEEILVPFVGTDFDEYQWYEFEVNPFEDAVQMIWGDDMFITPQVDIPEEAVILDDEDTNLVFLNRHQALAIVERLVPCTKDGLWLDAKGRVRDSRGRFAKAPKKERIAA